MTVNLTIDGVPVTAPKGTLLVEAAKSVKQEIPIYCYHTKLGPAGLCRVCLVEIEGTPKLQIACNTPVAEGMVVRTRGERVEAGRAVILELLLVNHPLDCPICDKGGECDLQDYAMAYARGYSDVADPKLRRPKAVDLGPTIVLDEERCIVCQRCVRFDDIIADERQLVVKDRGVHDIIATATSQPYRHNFTGNVTELCPVGALTSKIYRFKSRPWDLQRTQTTCTQCAVGCQQFADVRYGTILRTMSVEHDDAISDGWLCDRGRYNIGFYASPERLTQPLYNKGGEFVQIGWDDAFALWAKAISESIATHGASSIGAIGGGRLTTEEAYVLQYLFRRLGVRNLDWRAGRQRQATPGRRGAPLAAIERAQAIVIAGASPQERAPVMWLRVHKAALQAGAKIVETNSPQAALEAIGSDLSRVALLWDGEDLELGRAFARAFAGVAELSAFISSEQANARGAEAMGMLPNFGPGYEPVPAGRDTFGMLDDARSGKLRVLSIFGANPARNAPNGGEAEAALANVPFLVVSDLFETETTRHAKLILPVKGAFEKQGTTLNLAGDVLAVNQSLEAPDGVLADLELLIGLAQQLEVELPTREAVDAAVAAHAGASPEVELGDERFACGVAGHADGAAAGAQPILSGGGTWQHDPTLAPLRGASACSR
jgi:NADH-quinone oxidoreductase subunit G